MIFEKAQQRIRAGLIRLACCSMPLALTASCDPYHGTLDVFRYDDGFFDVFYDDCSFFGCYDEIVFFD